MTASTSETMNGPPKNDHDQVTSQLFLLVKPAHSAIKHDILIGKKNQIMARAVMLPITDFKPGTPRLDGRVERLKAIISNMESQDRQVR
jgi:hypothetical protein